MVGNNLIEKTGKWADNLHKSVALFASGGSRIKFVGVPSSKNFLLNFVFKHN
jgi:hypothetical protein